MRGSLSCLWTPNSTQRKGTCPMTCQTLATFVDNHAKREVAPMDLPHYATFLLSNHGWCSNYCTFARDPYVETSEVGCRSSALRVEQPKRSAFACFLQLPTVWSPVSLPVSSWQLDPDFQTRPWNSSVKTRRTPDIEIRGILWIFIRPKTRQNLSSTFINHMTILMSVKPIPHWYIYK